MNINNAEQKFLTVKAIMSYQKTHKMNLKEASIIFYNRTKKKKIKTGFICKSANSFYGAVVRIKNSDEFDSENSN